MTGSEFVATVVVCEGDRVTLDLLCDRLASDRYELLAAGTAEEALRLCRHQRPDLLVVDLELPDGEGPELLCRIREAHWLQTQIDPYLPVIALRPRARDPWSGQDPTWRPTTISRSPLPTRTSVPGSTRSSVAVTAASTSR
ncbi:MAG: response regulator [Actinobacteria bacterium]|nr:response regulator [Actinomycetota bacterium]